jgi:hypothetical protein
MKIITKERKSTYYDIDKPCCKSMKKHLNKSDLVIWMDLNGNILIGDKWKDNANISYCPFCGEKIIDEIEEIFSKGAHPI